MTPQERKKLVAVMDTAEDLVKRMRSLLVEFSPAQQAVLDQIVPESTPLGDITASIDAGRVDLKHLIQTYREGGKDIDALETIAEGLDDILQDLRNLRP